MSGGSLERWRERGGRGVRIKLPFADIMEMALALSPDELEQLGWRFDARKRLLEHFLAAGKNADAIDRDALNKTILSVRLPLREVRRLQQFARRDWPKMASRADVIDRLETALDMVLG